MNDLSLIHTLTKNYGSLQGLKMIPFGLYFLALGAGWLGSAGDCTYSLPALVVAAVIYMGISTYYDRTFGRVRPLPTSPVIESLKLALALVLIWIAAYVDSEVRLPVNMVGLTLAALLMVWQWRAGMPRLHYLVMAGLLAIVSLLPLVGVSTGSEIIQPPGASFSFIIAAILIAGGILDHVLLVRALGAVQEKSHG